MVRIRPDDEGGSGGSGTVDAVRAQMGTIRAALDPMGGDQSIKNKSYAAAGTTPDAVVSQNESTPDVVAAGGGFDNPAGSTGQRVKDVILGTDDGGAAVKTKGGEVTGLGPKVSRLFDGSGGSGDPGGDPPPERNPPGSSDDSTWNPLAGDPGTTVIPFLGGQQGQNPMAGLMPGLLAGMMGQQSGQKQGGGGLGMKALLAAGGIFAGFMAVVAVIASRGS